MIRITSQPEPQSTLYLNGKFVGYINSYLELLDIRLKILKGGLIGYTIDFRGTTIIIRDDGDLNKWPKGFYDEADKLLIELIKLRREKFKK